MDETLRIKLVVDTAQANSATKNLKNSFDNTSSEVGKIETSINKLGGSMRALGAINLGVGFSNMGNGVQSVLKSTNLLKSNISKITSNALSGLKNISSKAGSLIDSLVGNNPLNDLNQLTGGIRDQFDDLYNSLQESANNYTFSGLTAQRQAGQLVELRSDFEALNESTATGEEQLYEFFNQTKKDFKGFVNDVEKQVDEYEKLLERLLKGPDKTRSQLYDERMVERLGKFNAKFPILGRLNSLPGFKQLRDSVYGLVTLFETGFKTIRSVVQNTFSGGGLKASITGMADSFKDLGTAALKALGFLGKGLLAIVAIGTVAAVKNAFSVSKLGNDIDKASQKVGMSTKEFQRWSYILERCGVDASNLKTAMRSLTAASMNKQNSSYFTQLGIDPDKLTQEQLFEKTVTELQKVEDRTVRAQMAYKLFGRASAELAPFLALNADEIARLSYQYELLGARMNGSVIRASVNLTDALQDLRAAWQGLKNTLAQGILPIITNIIVKITVLIAKINMILQVLFGVDDAAAGITDRTQTITKNTQATAAAVKKLKTLIAGFDELNIFPSQDNPNGDIGSFLDDLEDYGNFGDIEPGQILPEWAIKELENFRDNILPGIIEKLEKLKETVKSMKGIWKGTEIADEGWEVAFDVITAPIRAALDLVDQLASGIGALFEGRGLKGLWEEWFSIDGLELPDTDWLAAWWDAVINGTDETMGIRDIPGLREIYNFFDWLLNFDTLNLSDVFDFDWLGEIENFEPPKNFIEFIDQLFGIDIDWDRGIWKHLQDFINWFDENKGKLGTGLKWEDILGNVEDWDIWKGSFWSGLWDKIKAWFRQNGEKLKVGLFQEGMFGKIGEWDIWKGSFWETKWSSIKTWFNQNVAPKFTLSYWTGKFASIKQGLSNTALAKAFQGDWSGIRQWFNTNVAPKFTLAYWRSKFESIRQGAAQTPIGKKMSEIWEGVKTWWNKNIAPKFTWTYWRDKFNVIPNGLGYASILTKMKDKWAEVKSWWDKNVSPKFTWTYWRDKFNSIKTGLSNVSLVGVAKSMINGLINTLESGLNRIIDKLNGSGILSALRTVGVNVWLNRVYIPRLAKGGIIDEPTMAMMGEYPGARSNPEIVTPERRLTQIFENSNDDIVGVLVQGFRQIISAIDDKDLSVSLGDTQIAKSAARGNNQYRLQTGTSLF